MPAEQLRQTIRPQVFHMVEKGTGTPGGGTRRLEDRRQSETEPHPLVKVFELGEKLIHEGKMTREQFNKKIESLSYEGPAVGP